MSVRAKFNCQSVTKFASGSQVAFSAVYSQTGENKDFVAASPSGNLSIAISEGYPAAKFFEPGKDYYLDFTEAPKQE